MTRRGNGSLRPLGQSPLPQCFPQGSFPGRSSGTPPPSSASPLQPEPSRTTKLAYAAGPSLWHLAPQGCVFFGAHLGFWALLLPHCTLSPCPASPPLAQVAGIPCQYWPSDAGLSRIFLSVAGLPWDISILVSGLDETLEKKPLPAAQQGPQVWKEGQGTVLPLGPGRSLMDVLHSYLKEPPGSQPRRGWGDLGVNCQARSTLNGQRP